jgi:soluble lytic murein transglycosylase
VRRALRRAARGLATLAALHGPVVAAPLGAPLPGEAAGAAVRWPRAEPAPRAPGSLAARLGAARDRTDSLAAWGAALDDSLLRPYALRRVAALHLALGDSLGADRLWASLAAERAIWQWEAVRARVALAVARGDTAWADSLLEREPRAGWPDGERAEWLARRVALRAALGDTAGALAFAGQALARYPGSTATSGTLRLLEALHAARGDSLPAAGEALAAEVERLRGRREAAVARLARAGRLAPAPGLELRRARLLRELGRFDAARLAAAAALRGSRAAPDSFESWMERARIERDAGDVRAALAGYARAGRVGSGGAAEAGWERARLLEDRGRWKEARAGYERVAAVAGPRAEAAALRAGLVSLVAGEPGAALRAFGRADSEAARFWRGVTLRRTRRSSGDSLLRALARRPGYAFYRSAARDTLGLRGWPGGPPRPPGAAEEPAVRLARALDELGCGEDAALVLERWSGGDARLARPGAGAGEPPPGALLGAAAAAYRADRPRQAIRLAGLAAEALARGPDSLAWAVSPWLYPPAHDSLFAAWPESAAAGRVERALLRAVAWKESRFDPRARSRSDAVGLLQLKRPAVSDVAGWFREAPPSDSALADPALNLRYGARYLERQLARFGGDLPLALAAYNAGATVAKRWVRLRALGGDALACEEIDYPETQDYVKTILAVRQAYRELAPAFGP